MQSVVNFLNNIGLKTIITQEKSYFQQTFLNNVLIKNGELLINQNTKISDLLHEAGHLAVLHPQYRKFANNDISGVIQKMITEINVLQKENQKYQYCEDECATAWAYAVGVHLNLDNKMIIEKKQYGGTGKDVIFALKNNCHRGIKELQYAGFCVQQSSAKLLKEFADLPVYPQLAKWVQD